MPIINQATYPRLGGVNIGGDHDYEDLAYQAKLAKLDVIILNTWPGWNNSKRNLETVVQNIKRLNPKIRVYNYEISMEVDLASLSYKPVSDKVEASGWWVKGADGLKVKSEYGNQTGKQIYQINTLRGWDWHARWAVDNLYKPSPSLDGFFEDNTFYQPRVSGDWNQDGKIETPAQIGQAHRDGYKARFALLHQLLGSGKTMIGNITDWGTKAADLTGLAGTLEGGLMEGLMGVSYSPETWGSWTEMMRWYRKTMAALASPKLGMFHMNGSATDYQGLRYGLTSCLLDDGYFTFSDPATGYADVIWFDEYNVKLGTAITSPSLSAWQSGVFRRDFENGIVLCNPKGNGPQTVTLESGWAKFKGTQDPLTNNGKQVTSVTLKDRDGLILVRSKLTPNAPKLGVL